ncbi:Cell division and transport-associated protein TolA [Sulfitobacter marinus]|uniref:Cell division and transport-associated protein TolA n=1 Tax=Sulfitobacter marinus TaxID=394264 RepID=A0A1I6UDR5_9RHOB|nr:energy transducer TonB [Sulfitobacter marinus]SFS99544.1 Cell division and transport-associated protein TolA [Sulfitobacter marinus]
MHTGHYISGVGHVGLIAFLLFGGLFRPNPEPFEMQEVSVLSAAEFDALVAASQSSEEVTEVTQPEAPQAPTETPAVAAEPEIQEPAPAEPAAPEPEPEVVEPTPPPPAAEVSETAPELPEPPAEVAVLAPEVAPVAVPRPVDRVAPEAVEQPDPEARPDVVEQEAATPDAPAERVVEEAQEATAPEEATTEIVTEAAEAPKAAPDQSPRPPARRPTPPAPQVAEPVATPKPAQPAVDQDAVAAALAEAMGGEETPAPVAAPSGPPLSSGEKESLRLAVSACWNVGSLSSEALRTTVIVSVQMNQDGTPQNNSITMTGSSGGIPAAAGQAFEAARRAIIRCGSRGYQLPVDKFDQWQNIEMTFNPERMRIK